jgi:hypothetical protein
MARVRNRPRAGGGTSYQVRWVLGGGRLHRHPTPRHRGLDGRAADLPASGKSIRNRHGLLFSILLHGQKRLGLRPDNPAELTRLPSKDGELGRRHPRHRTPLGRARRAAPRRPVLPRRPDGADPRDARLVQARPDEDGPINRAAGENRTWKLGPPKSRRSRHVVVRGEDAVRLRQAVAGHQPETYVFRTAEGNPWRYPDFHSDRWVPARNEAVRRGLTKHATPHMLRHTTVVWSLAAGVRIEVVSEQLGHASLQITYDVYGGLINLHDPVMAEAMAREMLTIAQAIVPRPDPGEIDRRTIRPVGKDGTRRRSG